MKKSGMNNKKGITSKTIIEILIVIASFVVVLLFLFYLNLKGIIGESSCTNSLTWKSIPLINHLISVNCESQDVCINMGGTCTGAGKDTQNIRITDSQEVFSQLKDLTDVCWSTAGRGDITGIGSGECGICYIVYFDGNVQKKIVSFPKEEVYKQSMSIFGFSDVKMFEALVKTENDANSLSTASPVAVISLGKDWGGKHNIVVLSQYDLRSLQNSGCSSFVF